MDDIPWKEAVKLVAPHVVKIHTPQVSGTGFLCSYAASNSMCVIATAAHVIERSHNWEELIRIQHYNSGQIMLLRTADRVIFMNSALDSAVIVFRKQDLPFPSAPLSFGPQGRHLQIGVEIGWVGFPAIAPQKLCFFKGVNSCWIQDTLTYLVDGVAINGVSGGPAFKVTPTGAEIVGSVSAYLPNRAGVTPGLAMISDFTHYHKVIKDLKDWEDAKNKEKQTNEQKEQKDDNKQDKI